MMGMFFVFAFVLLAASLLAFTLGSMLCKETQGNLALRDEKMKVTNLEGKVTILEAKNAELLAKLQKWETRAELLESRISEAVKALGNSE